MKQIYVYDNQEDKFISLLLGCFMEVDEDKLQQMLIVANNITREFKILKVYLENNLNYMCASCEFYYTDRQSLEYNIRKSLQLLGKIRTSLREALKKLSD